MTTPGTSPTVTVSDPIRLALPSKGHLYEGIVDILKTAGYKVKRASDRQYEATIAGHPRFHVVFMRPSDIVTQVQEGRCHLGVTGMDVYAERAAEAADTVVVTADLGYGGCRLVVAVPESWVDVTHVIDLVDLTSEFKSTGRTFRVSTKYPALTQTHFRRWGIYYYQLIDSDGALELHPSLEIADIIVDLTSSGTTLKDNRLKEIEQGTVLESAACLIGHAPGPASALAAEGGDRPPRPVARRSWTASARRRGCYTWRSSAVPPLLVPRRRPRWPITSAFKVLNTSFAAKSGTIPAVPAGA